MPKLKFQGGYIPTCAIDITEEEQALLNSWPSEDRMSLCENLFYRMSDEIDRAVANRQGGIYITGCFYHDLVDGLPLFDPRSEVSEDED